MKYKYQYIVDEENEKLRQKLAELKRERNNAFVKAFIIWFVTNAVLWYILKC